MISMPRHAFIVGVVNNPLLPSTSHPLQNSCWHSYINDMSRREFVCDKEESASPYPDLDDSEQPSVHQGRALGIYLT
jgi:hypothetical protein